MKTIQELKDRKYFFELCDNFINGKYEKLSKEDKKILLNKIENIIKEENLNPSRIKSVGEWSLLNFIIMKKAKPLFNLLIKYSNDDETPKELINSWQVVAYIGEKYYFDRLKKRGYIKNINKKGIESPLGAFLPSLSNRVLVHPNLLFRDEMFKFYLDNGADINARNSKFNPVMNNFMYFLLNNKIGIDNINYKEFVEESIKNGFDINLVYNNKEGNDFILDYFSIYYKNIRNIITNLNQNSHVVENLNYYIKIIEEHNYNFNNKNKKGFGLLDVIEEYPVNIFLDKIKMINQKKILEKSLSNKEEYIIKKRL